MYHNQIFTLYQHDIVLYSGFGLSNVVPLGQVVPRLLITGSGHEDWTALRLSAKQPSKSLISSQG